MKNLLITLIAALSIIYLGCEETTEPEDDNGSSTHITKVEGKISNWTLGAGKEIKLGMETDSAFVFFGSSTVGSDGSFSITLQAPASNLLQPIGAGGATCTGTVTANPTDLIGFGGQEALQVYSGTNYLGNVFYGKTANDTLSTVGDVNSVLSYLNKDGSFSGSLTCADTYGSWKMIFDNLTGKQGWNRYFLSLTVKGSATTTTTFNMSKTEPSGCKWIFR